jgi:hypothetical protein
MTKLSRPYITRIAAGERPVTQTVAAAVITGLRAEVKRLQTQAVMVATLAYNYEEQEFGA